MWLLIIVTTLINIMTFGVVELATYETENIHDTAYIDTNDNEYPYTHFIIDMEFYEGLTYRDIFEDNNLQY